MPGTPEFQRRLESIEELLGRIESAADPAVRAVSGSCVQTGHGHCMARGSDEMLETDSRGRRRRQIAGLKNGAGRSGFKSAGPVWTSPVKLGGIPGAGACAREAFAPA